MSDIVPPSKEFVPQRISDREKRSLEGFLATVCQISVLLKQIKMGSSQSTTHGGIKVRTRKKEHDKDFALLLPELRKIMNQGDLANLETVRAIVDKLVPPRRRFEVDEIDRLLKNKLPDTEHGMHIHLMGEAQDWRYLPNTKKLLEAGCNAAGHSNPEPWNRIVQNLGEDRAEAALHAAAFGLGTHLVNYANLTVVSAAIAAYQNGDIIARHPQGKTVTYLWLHTDNPSADIALNYRFAIQDSKVEVEFLKQGLLNRTKARIHFVEIMPRTSIQKVERSKWLTHHEAEAVLRDIPEYHDAELIGYVSVGESESVVLLTESILEERVGAILREAK